MHAYDRYNAWRCLHANEQDYSFYSISSTLPSQLFAGEIVEKLVCSITHCGHANQYVHFGTKSSLPYQIFVTKTFCLTLSYPTPSYT